MVNLEREFREVEPRIRNNSRVQDLCEAISLCEREGDLLLKFLRDNKTDNEIEWAANRWAAAVLLMEGKTVTDTAKILGINEATVGHVNEWVNGINATGGYWGVFHRLKRKRG